jgi:hypothetical protein
MMTCGWVVRHLRSLDGWDEIRAYRMMFFAYAVLGLIKLSLTLALSKKVELEKEGPPKPVDPEQAPLLGESTQANGAHPDMKKSKKRSLKSILPAISPESRIIVVNLCLLFSLDALASGLVPL